MFLAWLDNESGCTMPRIVRESKKSRGLIRSLNRSGVRDDKSPAVVRKAAIPKDPSICERCGAVFERKTWRGDRKVTEDLTAKADWTVCPACQQVSHLEGQGRLMLLGSGVAAKSELIRRRIENVAKRAASTQPERRVVSIDELGSTGADGLEVLTTSQKLAHRIAHELKKLLGGSATYSWQDDGTLFATWRYDLPTSSPKRRG
jgi:NMD protein affecting ribosome stability and mRNA decay